MLNKSFRETVKSWALGTTAHGFPKIADNTDRKPYMIVWTIALLISTCICVYQLSSNIIEYTNHQVETQVEIIRESNSAMSFFPTVSFCFLQKCDLENFDYKAYVDRYLKETNKKETSIKELMDNLKEKFVDGWHQNYTNNNLLNMTLPTSSIKEKMISCQFSSDFCNEYDFEPFKLNEYLSCYRFNGGKSMNGSELEPKLARRYGKSYGLQIELYTGIPEKCRSPLGTPNGLIVYVHNRTDKINEDDNGYFLTPGTETNLAIGRTFISKKPYPYSDCIENTNYNSATNEYVKETFKKNGNYSQKTCLSLCYDKFLVEKFNCTNNNTYINCNNPSKNYKDQYKADGKKNCELNCHIECERVIYDATISSSQFPTMTYSQVLIYNENMTKYFLPNTQHQLVKESTLSVNVFYKTDLFTKISEKEAITLTMFISNIGGSLGLFLGMSLLSLIEVVQIFCQCFALLVKRIFVGNNVSNETLKNSIDAK